jgi:hypothetical protein
MRMWSCATRGVIAVEIAVAYDLAAHGGTGTERVVRGAVLRGEISAVNDGRSNDLIGGVVNDFTEAVRAGQHG